MMFNDVDGIYSYTFKTEKKDDCMACSQVPQSLTIKDPCKMKLKNLIELLCESASFQMKSPALTTSIGGKNKTLYMSNIKSIEEQTRGNLNKTLVELGLSDGAELMVTDLTAPSPYTIKLKFVNEDVEMSS